MRNGDEGNQITFDDVTGAVKFTNTKTGKVKVIHLSACAWLEFESKPPPTPEAAKK